MNAVSVVILAAIATVGLAIAVWVFLPAFQGPAAARRDLGSHRLTFGAWVTVLVLAELISLPVRPFLHVDQGLTTASFLVVAIVSDLPMLLIVYVRVIMPRALTWRDLGLRPVPLEYALRFGLGAGIAGLIMSAIVESLLSELGLRPNQLDQVRFVLTEGPVALGVLLFVGGLVAPVVEELFFRGFLFGTYRRRQPLWLAYIVPGLLFTILHLDPNRMTPSQMAGLSVGIFMLAMLLTWLYEHTGSLYPGILAHTLNNATGILLFYFQGTR